MRWGVERSVPQDGTEQTLCVRWPNTWTLGGGVLAQCKECQSQGGCYADVSAAILPTAGEAVDELPTAGG